MDRLVNDQRVRDFTLIGVKLMDVAARAGFVLLATYSLRIDQAGQFGLIVTLVGLFAFAFNFERQIDIQRRTAGGTQQLFDRAVTQALKFFVFNWAFMIPLFIGAITWWTHAGPMILLLAALVVVGEHLSNQVYQYALISPRYRPLLTIVMVKNVILLCLLCGWSFGAHHRGDLNLVLQIWGGGAVLGTAALSVIWWLRRDPIALAGPFDFSAEIISQHRASLTHFLIGLLAILILQYDRLAVGALMTLAQTGVYFRHTLLVSFAYQAFNIASFNRITPSVFAAAKTKEPPHLRRMVTREYMKTLLGTPVLLAAVCGLDVVTHGMVSQRFQLNIALIALLLVGFLLRVAADFPALVMNAYHRERLALHRQSIAFIVGAALLVGLTWKLGMWGAALASIGANGLYATLNWQVLRRLPTFVTSRPLPESSATWGGLTG